MQEPIPQILKAARRQLKQGDRVKAIQQVQAGLRRQKLDAESAELAGRLLQLAEFSEFAETVHRVDLLAQCTAAYLKDVLVATAWGKRMALDVVEGGYDTVLQDLYGLPANRAGVTVLLPWNQRILAAAESSIDQRIDSELNFWTQAWQVIEKSSSKILQVGYDWVHPRQEGYIGTGRVGGVAHTVHRMNERLRENLPAGAYYVDLESISGFTGRERFYDPRSYHWTKQPFSGAGLVALADHLAAGIRALTTGPKKVLIVDLDNTLWGGVVGEEGPTGVSIGGTPEGDAYRAFQLYVKSLAKSGVLLAVCSKNNHEDAIEPFQTNQEMSLSLDDFACFEASWDPKPMAIRRIAKTLNLGLDSLVFFDDNPAEREQVRQQLPEVEVIEAPQEPAFYVDALQRSLLFESVGVTGVDQVRADFYRQESKRREVEASSASLSDYLDSLEMRAQVAPLIPTDMDRVVQLIGRTNQFNLTTRRHSPSEVRRISETSGTVTATVRLTDCFGDYGLISVLLAVPEASENRALRIDTWLMSCRAIGRTVEEFVFNYLLEQATACHYDRIIGEYLPTAKNALVADLLPRFGFNPAPDQSTGQSQQFVLSLADARKQMTHVVPIQDDVSTRE